MNQGKGEILVVPSSSDQVQDSKGLLGSVAVPVGVSVDQLKNNVATFVDSVNTMLSGIPKGIGMFNLDEIELTVEISAEASIRLVGGVKTGATGGITLRLKR